MPFILDLLPQAWPWLVLMTALAIGWAGQVRLALCLLALWFGICLSLGILSPLGGAVALAGLLLAAGLPRLRGMARGFGWVALILWCLSLAAHLVPGFNNLLVLDQIRTSPQAAPYTLYLNADKPLVFFALLLAWPPLLQTDSPLRPRPLFGAVLLMLALFPLALALGALSYDPTLPAWTGLFVLSNLLLTSLVEEAFFRGFLQKALTPRLGPAVAVALASLLFGLAHFGGGPVVMLFAGLLGLACGLGLWFSGRLWVAVTMHFAFNLIHLLLFTYPLAG